MVAEGFIGDRVQLSGLNVPLELTIPCRGVERDEPSSKLGELFGRQGPDLFLDGF